eukprot:COSAG02_NODE_52460_length_307_cov_1.485577_2_plen_43_part_01
MVLSAGAVGVQGLLPLIPTHPSISMVTPESEPSEIEPAEFASM